MTLKFKDSQLHSLSLIYSLKLYMEEDFFLITHSIWLQGLIKTEKELFTAMMLSEVMEVIEQWLKVVEHI